MLSQLVDLSLDVVDYIKAMKSNFKVMTHVDCFVKAGLMKKQRKIRTGRTMTEMTCLFSSSLLFVVIVNVILEGKG